MMQAIPVSWNGITYPSISAAAKANDVAPQIMHTYIRNGHTCDDDVKKSHI